MASVFWAAMRRKPRPWMCDGGVPQWYAPFVCSTRDMPSSESYFSALAASFRDRHSRSCSFPLNTRRVCSSALIIAACSSASWRNTDVLMYARQLFRDLGARHSTAADYCRERIIGHHGMMNAGLVRVFLRAPPCVLPSRSTFFGRFLRCALRSLLRAASSSFWWPLMVFPDRFERIASYEEQGPSRHKLEGHGNARGRHLSLS